MRFSNILAVVRRHWAIFALLVLVVICGVGGVFVFVAPVYEATASYLLLKPPQPPTDAEIEADPSLKDVNSDNPYVRFSDPSVILNVVARRAVDDDTKARLLAAGIEDSYTVSPSSRFGFSSPILDVTVDSSDAQQALESVKVVGQSVVDELANVQAVEGVDEKYTYTTRLIDSPEKAIARTSGKLRAAVATVGAGAVLFMVLVGFLQGRDRRRFGDVLDPRERLGFVPPDQMTGVVRPQRRSDEALGIGRTTRSRWLRIDSDGSSSSRGSSARQLGRGQGLSGGSDKASGE